MKNSKEYLDRIVKILEVPYFREMENYGIRDIEEQEYILCKLYGFDISIDGFDILFNYKRIYDINGNDLYYENSKGGWYKYEYNSSNKPIYYENGGGYWRIWRYNEEGKSIFEDNTDSDGKIIDNRNI
jgi:hypothetical protein